MAKKFTDQNFQEEVMDSNKLVIVDFWAEWCRPCNALSPTIDALSKEYDGTVSIGKMNVDDNVDIPATYNIRSIPTLLFFKKGENVGKLSGNVSKLAIEEKIKELFL